MKQNLVVAFDVDDTLIIPSVVTGNRDVPNYETIAVYRWFQSQGCHMVIWSGSGVDWAQTWGEKLGLQPDEIRVKGGAYGAHCSYDGNLGTLQFSSNSDPQPARTFGVFAALAQEDFRCDDEDVQAAIIAGIKTDERPLRPARACAQALWRELFGWTDERRGEIRRQLFALTPEHVRRGAAEFWQHSATLANDCVVAPAALASSLHYRTLTV